MRSRRHESAAATRPNRGEEREDEQPLPLLEMAPAIAVPMPIDVGYVPWRRVWRGEGDQEGAPALGNFPRSNTEQLIRGRHEPVAGDGVLNVIFGGLIHRAGLRPRRAIIAADSLLGEIFPHEILHGQRGGGIERGGEPDESVVVELAKIFGRERRHHAETVFG